MIKYYIIAFAVLLSTSCDKLNDNGKVFHVDLDRNHTVSIYDVFDHVEIIPLETTNQSIFSSALFINRAFDTYFILDTKLRSLFAFDDNGGFKFKISDYGQGTDEYLHLAGYNINKHDSTIELIDPIKKTLNIYTLDGVFKSKVKLPTLPSGTYHQMYDVDDDLVAFTAFSEMGRVIYYSRSKNEVISYNQKTFFDFTPNPIEITQNGKFIRAYENDVYELKSTGLEKAYSWDFGKYKNDLSLLVDFPTEPEEVMEYNMKLIRGEVMSYCLMMQFDNSKYAYLYIQKDGKFYNVLYNKQNDNYEKFEKFEEGVGFLPLYMNDEYIIGATGVDINNTIKAELLSEEDNMKLSNYKDDDNCMLVKYYFK